MWGAKNIVLEHSKNRKKATTQIPTLLVSALVKKRGVAY